MDRRNWLRVLALTPLAGLAGSLTLRPAFTAAIRSRLVPAINWKSLLAEGADVASSTETMKLPDAEWKKRLAPEAYKVLRHEGTERAGSSPLDREKLPGVFVCAGCDLPLFTSAMKFDSGTGWPSFFTTIPGAFGSSRDFKLILPRTEYHCSRCGGHHGHIFDDGPEPTGLRYCNNGVALRFIPKTGKA